MSRLPNPRWLLLAAMTTALVLTGCGGGDDSGTAPSTTAAPAVTTTTLSADQQAVQAVLRASVAAENSKDTKAFLAIWTDKGLGEFDTGSREEIASGKSGLGSDHVEWADIVDTTVTADAASSTVDALVGEYKVARPIYRAKFAMIRSSGKWLIDGFEFLGGPPPAPGTKVLALRAAEYAFALDPNTAPGNLAFRFTNAGKEQHEVSLFKGPDGVSLPTAKAALQNVNGEKLDNVPAGYQVDHVAFAEPGKSYDVTFAAPLPKGTYVLTCFIPQGGFGEKGPVNPNGKPHIQLGMITLLTVE